MLSNVTTMVLVLGGTLVCALALLYLSLLPGKPRTRAGRKRLSAEATTALMAASRDSDTADR